MPRPANFQKYWDAHPEEVKRPRGGRPSNKPFPKNGSTQDQMLWFRDEFLKLAKAEKGAKRAPLLGQALKAALEVSKASDKPLVDPQSEYKEHLQRMIENRQEENAEAERQN